MNEYYIIRRNIDSVLDYLSNVSSSYLGFTQNYLQAIQIPDEQIAQAFCSYCDLTAPEPGYNVVKVAIDFEAINNEDI